MTCPRSVPAAWSTVSRLSSDCASCAPMSPACRTAPSASADACPAQTNQRDGGSDVRTACAKPYWSCQVQGLIVSWVVVLMDNLRFELGRQGGAGDAHCCTGR